MNFSVVAAIDSNRGIGKAGALAWRLKGDMDHFRLLTLGEGNNAVIMGRTTWESLPDKFRPLPGRLNVVLSRQLLALPNGVLLAGSLDEALILPQLSSLKEVFIIGGANVYAQAVNHHSCNKIYLTEIESKYDCDTYFPELPANFMKESESDIVSEAGVNFRFVVYAKR